MQTISVRYLKAGAVPSLLALIIFIADRCEILYLIKPPVQIALLFALALITLGMTTASARGDARRARVEMDAFLDGAALEDMKAKRLCVMASALIRCCLEEDEKADVLGAVSGRYELVSNARGLENMISSNALLKKNARLLELQQMLQTAENARAENECKYEARLKNYCSVRASLKSERLRKLFDLEVYPTKEPPSKAQECLVGVDMTALQSKMQICSAWAKI